MLPEPSAVPVRQSSKKDDDFDIKSYHSSEEEDKKRQKQVAKEKINERREVSKLAAPASQASDDFPQAIDLDASMEERYDKVMQISQELEPESRYETIAVDAPVSSQDSAPASCSNEDEGDDESKEQDVADEHTEAVNEEIYDKSEKEAASAQSKSDNSQDNLPLFQERRYLELKKSQKTMAAAKKKKEKADR